MPGMHSNGAKAVDLIQEAQNGDFCEQFFTPEKEGVSEDDIMDLNQMIETCENHLAICENQCVRCGVHTLNLVVNDATKSSEKELKAVTKIVKSYRKIEYQQQIKYSGIAMPPIPSKIRWNHYYLMLNSIVCNKQFFAGLGVKHPELGKKMNV